MKPFDLEKALAGEKVVTRDGREVKITSIDQNSVYCVCGEVLQNQALLTWDLKGKFFKPHKHKTDLFMA